MTRRELQYQRPTGRPGTGLGPAHGSRVLAAGLLVAVALSLDGAAWAQSKAGPEGEDANLVGDAISALPEQYRRWLAAVEGLISEPERDYFLGLRSDYRRDAFIDAFWKVRDPDPRTGVNELKRRFDELQASAGDLPLGDPRALLYLLNGPPGRWTLPDGRPVARCFARSRELEIWFYRGSERTARSFIVVFQMISRSRGYEVWRPGAPLRPFQRRRLPTTQVDQLCSDDLIRYALFEISRATNYQRLLDEVTSAPAPSAEWLATFAGGTTDLPEGAETFTVTPRITFPARNQSRTALAAIVAVPLSEAPGRRFDGRLFHNFQLIGEVLRDGALFESFRYSFEGPTPEDLDEVPLGFTRYLRSGPIQLRLLIEDVFTERFSQLVLDIDVPSPNGLPQVERKRLGPPTSDRPSLTLSAPRGGVAVGLRRFTARTTGEVDRVAFFLDGKQVLSKRRPPFSVELDLGKVPEPHRVRGVAYAGEQEVATDQVWLNQGAQRFRVRLVEPRPGGLYPGSLVARARVEAPDGQPPERVEFYLGDQLIAARREQPFAAVIELSNDQPAVVRSVAYLSDGSSAEDAVLVNSAAFQTQVEVRLVEVPVLVLDGEGQPVRNLSKEQFRLFDNGEPREIEQFEWSESNPIAVSLVVDRSASMGDGLRTLGAAALEFARAALSSPEDRLTVISFADQASIDASLSTDPSEIERVLAGLVANGGTALYDSLALSINFYQGISGQKAVLLFTDGQDESSRLTLDQVVETARRSNVSIYVIALAEAFDDRSARRALEELTAETGGTSTFIESLEQVGNVYDQVLRELRGRYLLAFRSAAEGTGEVHQIDVRVEAAVEGLEVRARKGYTP